jgi:hypothetical protein
MLKMKIDYNRFRKKRNTAKVPRDYSYREFQLPIYTPDMVRELQFPLHALDMVREFQFLNPLPGDFC